MRAFLQVAASIAIAQLAGLIGAWSTASSVRTWYPTLEKPWFTPPDWLFGPAWVVLYTLMGIAAWLVWRQAPADSGTRWALVLYGVQLGLNALWSPAFFGLQAPALGLVVIGTLVVALAGTIVAFARVSAAAAWLMAPYLAWVLYATALNFEIWRLN